VFELKRNYINQDETRVLSPLPTTYIYFVISILHYVIHSCPPLTTMSPPHVSLYLLCHYSVIRMKTNCYRDNEIENLKNFTIQTSLTRMNKPFRLILTGLGGIIPFGFKCTKLRSFVGSGKSCKMITVDDEVVFCIQHSNKLGGLYRSRNRYLGLL